jgi:hypothetical protein
MEYFLSSLSELGNVSPDCGVLICVIVMEMSFLHNIKYILIKDSVTCLCLSRCSSRHVHVQNVTSLKTSSSFKEISVCLKVSFRFV